MYSVKSFIERTMFLNSNLSKWFEHCAKNCSVVCPSVITLEYSNDLKGFLLVSDTSSYWTTCLWSLSRRLNVTYRKIPAVFLFRTNLCTWTITLHKLIFQIVNIYNTLCRYTIILFLINNILIALFDFLDGRCVLYNKVKWNPVNLVT